MKRFLLLTVVSLVVSLVAYQPTIRTQDEYVEGLPDLNDFPEAKQSCKYKLKLAPWHGNPGAGNNRVRCVVHVTVCGAKIKKYRSEPREIGDEKLCEDFWQKHDELAKRTICCDEKPASCEPPSPASEPPWFDSRNCRDRRTSSWSGPQIVDFQNRPLPAGEVWCVINYYIPGEHPYDTQKTIPVVKKVTIDVATWRTDWRQGAEPACKSFFDSHESLPARTICPDVWDKAGDEFVRRGGSCDPIADPDCDGVPNFQDPFPLHPRSTEYVSNKPLTNFPFSKDLGNAVPHDPCECKWEFSDARYQCQNVKVSSSGRRGSSNQARYQYQVKWTCPDTGKTVVVNREVKMDGQYCPRSR